MVEIPQGFDRFPTNPDWTPIARAGVAASHMENPFGSVRSRANFGSNFKPCRTIVEENQGGNHTATTWLT